MKASPIIQLSGLVLSLLFFGGCGTKEKKEKRWQVPPSPAFYVWQRNWSKPVIEAVKRCDREIYLLGAEFTLKNGIIHCARPEIPETVKQNKNYICVFRIHTGLLGKLKPETIVREYKKFGGSKLQLDLDCPESRMKDYRQFLLELRKLLPDTELSITVLPCHLRHREFSNMVAMLDYYVLQVHGLEAPENFDNDVPIISRATAMSAIAHAEKLNFPYLIALPCYAYQLNFDKHSKRFKFLSAELSPLPDKNLIFKLTVLDMSLLRDIIKMRRKGGIIWFRLPVDNDRLNLDMSALNTLEQGHIPKPSLKLFFEQNSDNCIDLYVSTKNIVGHGSFQVRIDWPEKMGEFDLFNGTENLSDDRSFMVLPNKLGVPCSICGRKTKIGTFYIKSIPRNIEIIEK